ncbi:MAG: hypothetical protein ABID38_01105 [Candidatus Diapherotrites archaeon]
MKDKKKELILLDSSAVLNDFNFEFDSEKGYYTTSKVFGEFRDLRSRALVDNALKMETLKIVDACPLSVQNTMKEIGRTRLSDADISIAALARDFKKKNEIFLVITDDFSLQAALKKIGIKFKGVFRGSIK